MTIPADIRRQAVKAVIPLDVLLATYAELRQLARFERETGRKMRKRVRSQYAYSVESRPFWRHGMQARFGRAFAEGDMTNIPGWDDVAQSIKAEFPELTNVDDVAQHLFELIREPHQTMPPASETWQEALDRCGEWVAAANDDLAAVPF